MTAPAALSLAGVSKHYMSGGQPLIALDQTDMTVRAGKVTGIVGPSGSGKTTLLMIAGLIEAPTLGSVKLDGLDVQVDRATASDLAKLRRKHFGFVFQKPNLIPFLSARENVQIALQIDDVPQADARARADELLAELSVAHRAESMPNQMSGGEQQRVAISRALANRPRLLLADEPTASLDSERSRQVMALFSTLAQEENVGVVVVTHDLRWTDFFDEVLEMRDGRIVVRWEGRRR